MQAQVNIWAYFSYFDVGFTYMTDAIMDQNI